jgi:phasin family protein
MGRLPTPAVPGRVPGTTTALPGIRLIAHPRKDTMYNATEPFAELGKANVSNAIKFASLSIDKAEKIVALNLNAAKLALAQGVEGAQAAAGVKDVQELAALRSKLQELGVQTALGYSRSLYEISTEAQSEFSALAEEAWSAYTKGVASFVEKASQSAPAGSDVAFNAFKSTIAASTAAFDQFQKAARQVASFADANYRAVEASTAGTAGNGRGRRAAAQ